MTKTFGRILKLKRYIFLVSYNFYDMENLKTRIAAIAIIIECEILKALISIAKMEKNKYIHIITVLLLINLMLIYIGIKYNRF